MMRLETAVEFEGRHDSRHAESNNAVGHVSNVPENEHVGNVLHEDRATRGASLLSRADVATLLRPLAVLFDE